MSEKADHENLEEEDEEDEDEEEEPKLKYSRIGSALLEILKEDAASCMVVHPKVSKNLHYFLLIWNLGQSVKLQYVSPVL